MPAGITPDPNVDAYMKASALSGDKHSVTAEYMIRLLALDEASDVIVGPCRLSHANLHQLALSPLPAHLVCLS